MGTRLELHEKLKNLMNDEDREHVYYQPAENLKMEYPCIRYEKSDILDHYADNIKYAGMTRYDITIIDQLPDNEVISKILALPYSDFDRHYTSDNLNHDVIRLYF